MSLSQIIFEREVNIFYPVHKLLYTIIPVISAPTKNIVLILNVYSPLRIVQ